MMVINVKILAWSFVSSMAIFMMTNCVAVPSPIVATPSIVPEKNSSLAELGNTKVSQKDNATLVYIPAGQFPMGSEFGLMDEKPVHIVQLDAFWLDPFDPNTRNYSPFHVLRIPWVFPLPARDTAACVAAPGIGPLVKGVPHIDYGLAKTIIMMRQAFDVRFRNELESDALPKTLTI